MPADMLSLMSEMLIDEDKIYCPYRQINTKQHKKIIFSDHCAIILTLQLQCSTRTGDKGTTYKTWHYTEEGYTAYKNESEAHIEVKWHPNSTQAYSLWTNEFNNLLSRCFTKKTVKVGSTYRVQNAGKPVRDILAKVGKSGKIQRNIVKQYLERIVELESRQEAALKTKRLKETMSNLTENERFSPNGYWKMKKKLWIGI